MVSALPLSKLAALITIIKAKTASIKMAVHVTIKSFLIDNITKTFVM